jgi:hypothetical protein
MLAYANWAAASGHDLCTNLSCRLIMTACPRGERSATAQGWNAWEWIEDATNSARHPNRFAEQELA